MSVHFDEHLDENLEDCMSAEELGATCKGCDVPLHEEDLDEKYCPRCIDEVESVELARRM